LRLARLSTGFSPSRTGSALERFCWEAATPRQSNGVDIQPANTAAVSGQTISSTAFNTLVTDIYTEITNSLDRLGRSAMQAAFPMGGNKITGMADPTVSTDAATKNYVDTTTAAFFSTGDIKPTLKIVADAGWLMFNDNSFGSATSGANVASNATQALFTLIFNNISDANAPIQTAGGGATTRAGQTNAATAWAANCRIVLPLALGRAFGAAGAGSGLTARALGQPLGEETHLLNLTELPTGIHSSGTGTATAGGGRPNIPVTDGTISNGSVSGPGSNFPPVTSGSWGGVGSLAVAGTATSDNTGGGAHNNIQPTVFVNWMVRQ